MSILNLSEVNKLVINLPEREDRLKLFKEEIKYLGFDPQIVAGVKHQDPMLGIAQAHINCILIAKQNEWPYVLIMEDDVDFRAKEKTLPYIEESLQNLPEDWDLLLGGIYDTKGLSPFNSYWNRTQEFCGLHFYIVNSKCYDRILEYDFKHHIDRWMNMSGRLNCFVATKFFATQRDGFSDNVKQFTDYEHHLRRFKLLKY